MAINLCFSVPFCCVGPLGFTREHMQFKHRKAVIPKLIKTCFFFLFFFLFEAFDKTTEILPVFSEEENSTNRLIGFHEKAGIGVKRKKTIIRQVNKRHACRLHDGILG